MMETNVDRAERKPIGTGLAHDQEPWKPIWMSAKSLRAAVMMQTLDIHLGGGRG